MGDASHRHRHGNCLCSLCLDSTAPVPPAGCMHAKLASIGPRPVRYREGDRTFRDKDEALSNSRSTNRPTLHSLLTTCCLLQAAARYDREARERKEERKEARKVYFFTVLGLIALQLGLALLFRA